MTTSANVTTTSSEVISVDDWDGVEPQEEARNDKGLIRVVSSNVVSSSESEGGVQDGCDDNDDDDVQIIENDTDHSRAARAKLSASLASLKRRLDDDDETQVCPICYEAYDDLEGSHRLTSLHCGHCFGEKCIQQWLSQNPRCPSCKLNVRNKKFRVVSIKNGDRNSCERLKSELEAELKQLEALEEEEQRFRKARNKAEQELRLITGEYRQLVRSLPSTLASLHLHHVSSQAFSFLTPASAFTFGATPSVVGFTNVALSSSSTNSSSDGGWVAVVDMSVEPKEACGGAWTKGVHVGRVEDIQCCSRFDPCRWLTVGEDHKAVLFDSRCGQRSGHTTHEFTPSCLPRRCCFNRRHLNQAFVGDQQGHVYVLDLRRMEGSGGVVQTYVLPDLLPTPAVGSSQPWAIGSMEHGAAGVDPTSSSSRGVTQSQPHGALVVSGTFGAVAIDLQPAKPGVDSCAVVSTLVPPPKPSRGSDPTATVSLAYHSELPYVATCLDTTCSIRPVDHLSTILYDLSLALESEPPPPVTLSHPTSTTSSSSVDDLWLREDTATTPPQRAQGMPCMLLPHFTPVISPPSDCSFPFEVTATFAHVNPYYPSLLMVREVPSGSLLQCVDVGQPIRVLRHKLWMYSVEQTVACLVGDDCFQLYCTHK